MRLSRGVIGLLVYFGLFSGLYFSYMLEKAGGNVNIYKLLSYYAGSISAMCMAVCFVLAARPRFFEKAFGGLDKMYVVHKYLGILAVLLLTAHYFSLPGGDGGDEDHEPEPSQKVSMPLEQGVDQGPELQEISISLQESGEYNDDDDGFIETLLEPSGIGAAIGFMILVALALNRRFPYHRWYKTHRFMGLFFVFVIVHVGVVLTERGVMGVTSLPSLFLLTSLAIGLLAYLYKELIYPRLRQRFQIESVNALPRATELVLKPLGDMFAFNPGQFAFIKIDAPGLRESHPFTISSAPDEDCLKFTIKIAGDYTRLVNEGLTPGTKVGVDGPYGCFDTHGGPKKQVWIAGGIGVTPFVSSLRSLEPDHGKDIHMYYGFRRKQSAIFLEELCERAKAAGHVSLTCLASDDRQRITMDRLKKDLPGMLSDWHFYLCGPESLVAAMRKGLRKEGVPARNLHNEAFQIR